MPKPRIAKLTYSDLRAVVATVNREPIRIDQSKLNWSRWCVIGNTVSYHNTWFDAVTSALAMCETKTELLKERVLEARNA